MTERGRRLFEDYVKSHLNHPMFAALTIASHAFNVSSVAADARIPMSEIIEEVGPIAPALATVRRPKA